VRLAHSSQLCKSKPGREMGNLARTYMDEGISALFRDMSLASVNLYLQQTGFSQWNIDSLKEDSMTKEKR
jgi:hypothetical protein